MGGAWTPTRPERCRRGPLPGDHRRARADPGPCRANSLRPRAHFDCAGLRPGRPVSPSDLPHIRPRAKLSSRSASGPTARPSSEPARLAANSKEIGSTLTARAPVPGTSCLLSDVEPEPLRPVIPMEIGKEIGMGRETRSRSSGAPKDTVLGETRINPDLGRPRDEGMERADLTDREFRRPREEGAPSDSDLWSPSFPGCIDDSRQFRDVHLSDPETADRPVVGLTTQPEVGSEFLGFRLIGELGRGAFSSVYLARQDDLASRPVALKVSAVRFDESQTLAQLQHTNIVPIYSIHRVGRLLAVCMPYFGSTTLRDVYDDLQQQGALPVSGRGLLSTLYERKSSVHGLEEPSPSGNEEVARPDEGS